MPHRPLLLLFAFANFIIGLGAFVVIGVLSPIAGGFGLSKADAGWVMTAYALVYCVASPISVALTGHIDRARLLTANMALFGLGALICATAPAFAGLLAGRAAMALGAGLVTPVAAAIGASLVPPQQRGQALALVFGGFTIAQAFGVPLGSWLGYAFGWRAAFVLVAALSILGTAVLWFAAPRGLKAPPSSLSTLGQVIGTPHLLVAASLTAWFFGAIYCLYTFLAPFMEARFELGREGITLVLVTFGVCAIIGNALGGFCTDRFGFLKTLIGVSIGQAMLLPIITTVQMPLLPTVALTGIWSVVCFAFMAAQQARMVATDPSRAPTLLALHAAFIYLGGAVGAYVGGLTLKSAGYGGLGPAGALLALAGLGSILLASRLKPRVATP